jgi:hypothetical protein
LIGSLPGAKGLYSVNGILFLKWAFDTNGYQSPVVGDAYSRVYFSSAINDAYIPNSGPTDIFVTQVGFSAPLSLTGGGHQISTLGVDHWRAGVQLPGYPPVLSTQDASQFPGSPNVQFTINFYYESGGKQYQVTNSIATTEEQRFRKYLFTAPAITGGSVSSSNPSRLYVESLIVGTIDPATGTVESPTVSFINGAVSIISAHSVRLANGTQVDNVAFYTDENGAQHSFSDAVSGSADDRGTPDDATAQVVVLCTDTDKGTVLFKVASSSAGGTSSGALSNTISVSLAKVPDTDNDYEVTIGYGTADTRAYFYTLVNDWGEEGAPGFVETISTSVLQNVVALCRIQQSGDTRPITAFRLYRSNTSSRGITQYQLVKETGISSTFGNTQGGSLAQVIDDVEATKLGEVCASDLWEPPQGGLCRLDALPNGVFSAYKNNELHFSVPYRPWAWPSDWIITLPYVITGIMAIGSSVLVTTLGYPYLVGGSYPDSFTAQRIPIMQQGACGNAG